ncbi:MAG: SUF system Fe-S cluster assembly protein [Phycisphaerales bacterium]
MRIFDSGEQKNRVPPSQTPDPESLRGRIIDAIKGVYDPEIPVNLYDLGLIYSIEIDEPARCAHIRMTLTSPACPEAQTLPNRVREAVLGVDGIDHARVELVWEPRWGKDMMCDEAKLYLGLI